jgi:L-ascorbate metabolism protein UlaG (beta-lactamase superfamily)
MDIQITWLSRASWFKVKTKSKIIHIDPGYTGYFENQGIPIEELKDKADLIFVTHFHKDHLQPKAFEMISGNGTQVFAPQKCVERIRGKVNIVKPGDEFDVGGISIRAVNAYNTLEGNSTRKVHHKGDFVGYLVSLDGKTIYHAGDTDFIPEMKQLGKVDVAMLPIGGKFTMDVNEAVTATLAIEPRFVIPMHRSDADPNSFREKISARSKVKVVNLGVGEAFCLG